MTIKIKVVSGRRGNSVNFKVPTCVLQQLDINHKAKQDRLDSKSRNLRNEFDADISMIKKIV